MALGGIPLLGTARFLAEFSPCCFRTEARISFLVVVWESFTDSGSCSYSLLCGPQTVLVFINYQHRCLKGKLDTCHPNLICACVHVCMLSHVQLFVMPWSVPHQAPLSMGFSWQEYWSGASLVVWWLRILLAMQETLIQEDPTCHGQLSPCSATR